MSTSRSDAEEYEVERVLGKRAREGTTEYLVKWTGYPPSEATWEPLSSMQNCMRLVREFEKELARGKMKSRRSAPKTSSRAPMKSTCRQSAISLAGKQELAGLIASGASSLVLCLPLARAAIDAHIKSSHGTFLRLQPASAAEADGVYLRAEDCRRLLPKQVREYFSRVA